MRSSKASRSILTRCIERSFCWAAYMLAEAADKGMHKFHEARAALRDLAEAGDAA
jgi:hypothetical protein